MRERKRLFLPTPTPASVVLRGLLLSLVMLCIRPVQAEDEALRFFENEVRPLFIEQCSECHGGKKQEGGLRVDSRATLLKGGETGPAVVPGKPDASLLLQAVRREDGLEMPPDAPLNATQIASLTTWIEQGAVWPDEAPPTQTSTLEHAKDHWAFQPVIHPDVPNVENPKWVRTPIDAFVLSKLEDAGLSPSPEVDRRTLIRRLTYTLTGLPPSPEEIEEFENDPDPLAYEKQIDRLLDSAHYGEQWARHWLDVARYADTKGYVYAREERFWVHAWAYRDWITRALNNDMPYDRFLLLQIAADQVPDRDDTDLAAMGFLTLGRRFLGVQRDIIDDRIDVVTRGTMALTVGCARCHDHKYDPISTADYYSLYGVFDSCAEKLVAVGATPQDEAFQAELKTRHEKLQTTLAERRAESSARARSRVADYLKAQTELDRFPAQGFDQIFQESDLLPEFVRRWERYLRNAHRSGDPVFVPWHAYAELNADDFTTLAQGVTNELQSAEPETMNSLVTAAFAKPPASFAEVIERYAGLFTDIDTHWQALLEEAGESDPPMAFDEPAAEELRQVLYGPDSPSVVPDEPIVQTEAFFTTDVCTELWKLQGEVDRWIINSPVEATHAVTLLDRPTPHEPRIFLRGNPLRQGDDVPRRFLSALSDEDADPFRHGSGRLELAQAIIDPANPLTARVIVNRVWAHHFGEGLVTTPSDFGTRAGEPSHPKLLDWLTTRFIADGWSLKSLHRLILQSATYRQSSSDPNDVDRPTTARRIDPTNRLLWRMNEHRLSFEEFRDSVLAASGQLDGRVGGKPIELFKSPYPVRRTLYGLVDRQFLPSTLRMFDFANPDLHTPQRPETTVPQQALFLMNHPLIHEQARALATLTESAGTPEERVSELFERTLLRSPNETEISESLSLVQSAEFEETSGPPPTAVDWQYGYGAVNEETGRVDGFTPLPHSTGNAWQGGPSYPDGKLGWVQLTATGGHPGNDRAHACVRRWTAPRAMTISLQSSVTHEPAAGDGIRAFVISSQLGKLAEAIVHLSTKDLNVESLQVAAGDTIDLVVDIRDVLNSDQFLWTAKITDTDSETTWNSETDFPDEIVRQLNGWEQLAQVLFCSNEFLFVD
ncbi:MAG: PSD1 domain-containing protein [Planctomycetaceae bacterium]|nr:PSD1 domain-containing protein [Planctomycetaceae bacterium]